MKKYYPFLFPLLALGLFAVALGAVMFFKPSSQLSLANIISVVPAGNQQEGAFFIDPQEVTLQVLDSYEFSAFTQMGTHQIPVLSDWTATRKNGQNVEEPAPDIGLPNCQQTATCMVFAGNQTGEVTLHATDANNQEATAQFIIQPGEVAIQFKDEIPEWAKEAISALQKRGILSGYEDGRFAPEDKVTRGQFITMLYRLMPYYQIEAETLLKNKNCQVHSDVPEAHFAYKPVCFASYYGWEKGLTLEGDTLLPDNVLTRQEAAQLLYNAIAKHAYATQLLRYDRTPENTPSEFAARKFTDMNFRSPHAEAIGVVAFLSLMEGVQERGDRNFYPLRELNRAEAATLIWRTLNQIDWLQMIRATEGF